MQLLLKNSQSKTNIILYSKYIFIVIACKIRKENKLKKLLNLYCRSAFAWFYHNICRICINASSNNDISKYIQSFKKYNVHFLTPQNKNIIIKFVLSKKSKAHLFNIGHYFNSGWFQNCILNHYWNNYFNNGCFLIVVVTAPD